MPDAFFFLCFLPLIDYAQVAAKKYNKTISNFKPNLESYEEQKSKLMQGEDGFYRDSNSLAYAAGTAKPKPELVDKMVKDLEKQSVHQFPYLFFSFPFYYCCLKIRLYPSKSNCPSSSISIIIIKLFLLFLFLENFSPFFPWTFN